MFPMLFDKLPTSTDEELAMDKGVTGNANKEGNEGVKKGKAHITTSTDCDDKLQGVKVPVSAKNAYSMRRMLGPPQIQLGLVTNFQIIDMVMDFGESDQGNMYHHGWIVMNFDQGEPQLQNFLMVTIYW
ncbi:hypothetical protein V6N12_029936 [Hibiscus sabdariffa]|uniref:Uncharacterized protein n=1 Tax=Hibiscus sabdariffa TaxID=183260 RepID=A0ABR2CXX8_9ROSI